MSRVRTCKRPSVPQTRLKSCALRWLLRLQSAGLLRVQSAGKRGLRSRAEGLAVCAGWRPHGPPAAGPMCRVTCQGRRVEGLDRQTAILL